MLEHSATQEAAIETAPDYGSGQSPSTLGKRLRAAREKAGVTQEDLAKALETSTRSLIAWEKDVAVPRIDILPVLWHLCDVDAEWIANGRDLTPRSGFGVVDWVRYPRRE